MSTIELAEKLIELMYGIINLNAVATDKALTELCTALNIIKPHTFTIGQKLDQEILKTTFEAILDGVKAQYKDKTEVQTWT